MAHAGSMTTAYRLDMHKGALRVERTTFPSDRCTPPAEAVERLRNWRPDSAPVIVQGSDMAQFWQLWEGVN